MAACLVLVLGASGAAATTPQRLSGWQFDELRDPMDTRKSVSVLEYHISGTPGFRVFALCSREPASAGLVTLTLGTGVGRHADGAEVTLHLTGPASDHQVTGYVTDAMMINDHNRSVLVQLRADDPIWTGLLTRPRLEYRVPGNPAVALPLGDGAAKIRAFLDSCQTQRPPEPQAASAKPKHGAEKVKAVTVGRQPPTTEPVSRHSGMTGVGAGATGTPPTLVTAPFDVASHGPPEPARITPPLPAKVASLTRLETLPPTRRLTAITAPPAPARLQFPPLPGQASARISRRPLIEPPLPPRLAATAPAAGAPTTAPARGRHLDARLLAIRPEPSRAIRPARQPAVFNQPRLR